MMFFRRFFCRVCAAVVLLSVFPAFYGAGNLYAQQGGKKTFRVYAVVRDLITETPLEMATVTLMNASDTTKFKYASSDMNGKVTVSNVLPGKYIFKAEYMGYKTDRQMIEVKDRSLDMGVVSLEENVNMLDEVTVSAVGNPIVIKKDTLEYSASSYKIADSENLEDLLKKLLGIEVDSDGKITKDGQEITKIMIDGKPFFLNDPQIATKNLPANIIEKVKIYEKKSDQAEFTGIDDGEEETVIDLSVKKGMMDAWFGNATAGYGTDNRFQAGLMTSSFKEDSQITILANGNNTNNRGFFDFAGGMMESMRSMRNSGVRMGSFFGNKGITTSWMAGANANKELAGGKLKLSGSYMYSGSINDTENEQYKENFLEADSLLVNDNDNFSNTMSQGHMFGGEVDWKITDRTSILFKPQVNIGYGDFRENSDFETLNGLADGLSKVNDGYSRSNGDNNSITAKGNLLVRHRFGKKGRTISLDMKYEYSDNKSDMYNYSITRLYNGGELPNDSTVVDQHYNLRNTSSNVRARLSYTEPLGKDFYIEAAYSLRLNDSYSDKQAMNMNDVTGEYDIRDDEYSNTYNNLFINQSAEINLTQTKEKYRFVVGANVQPSYTKSVGDTSALVRNVVNFSPNAMFEYRFSDNENIRVRYNGRTNQPSLTQLQPVPDNSNPLLISEGNPSLLPEFSHNLNINYRYSNMKNFSMVYSSLRASYTMDKIINKSWYDDGGVQHTRPVNGDGVYNINAMLMANVPIAKSGFSVSTRTSAGFSNTYSYIRDLKNNTKTLSFSEWLRFMYRSDIVEATLGGFARYSRGWYSVDSQGQPSAWTNSVTASVNVSIPWGLNIKTDANYTFYLGYDEEFNEPSLVWNAEISKKLFKDKATLALKVYDILNQAKSVYRVTDDEYVMDVRTNSLKQYFMLTFIYRFGKFAGQGRGPMGPGGPRPPMHR